MRNLSAWLQLFILLACLYVLPDHVLEELIVLVFMYDVGFEIPALDKLIEANNKLRRSLSKKLDKNFFKKKKKPTDATGI